MTTKAPCPSETAATGTETETGKEIVAQTVEEIGIEAREGLEVAEVGDGGAIEAGAVVAGISNGWNQTEKAEHENIRFILECRLVFCHSRAAAQPTPWTVCPFD